MRRVLTFSLLALLPILAGGPAAAQEAETTEPGPRVALETTRGTIVLELHDEEAPETVANFLQYVRSGFFDGTVFHRVIPGFMVQGGGFTPDLAKKDTGDPVTNEANNGLRNLRGTVAMARTSDPHSATAQFFINTVDNASLDHTAETRSGWGYTVFGRVVEGLDVVDTISGVPTETRGRMRNVPVDAIVIEKAVVRSP